MNDGTNLFLALRYEASVDNNFLQFRFDNNHDGVRQLGEDGLSVFEFASFDLFFNSGNEPLDASSGGANDISGAFGDDGTSSVFELSHPLDSADDAHDFSLSPGDTTGVHFGLSLTEIIDVSFANTFYPSISVDPSTWADIVIAAPVEAPVGGEIIPTSAVSLFVAGAAANAFWIIPAIGGAAAAAIYGIVRARK
jgi:hypothetical protein